MAAGDVSLANATLVASDKLSASAGQALRTDQASLKAGTIDFSARSLSNREGQLYSAGATNLFLDTLDNRAGVIHADGQGNTGLTIHAGGTIDNRHGYLAGVSGLSMQSAALDNSNGGSVLSHGPASVVADIVDNRGGRIESSGVSSILSRSVDNRGGQVLAAGDLSIVATGSLDNSGSLLRSGGRLFVTAAQLINTGEGSDEQGMAGQDVRLEVQRLDNQGGAIRSNASTVIHSSGRADNTGGIISGGSLLALQDSSSARTLAIVNTGGTLIAGQNLAVDSAFLGGDGDVLSLGDMAIRLDQDYRNTGQMIADGRLDFRTAGALVNQAAFAAGRQLSVQAADIANLASASIKGRSVFASASHAIDNRGLIDGSETTINTALLNNLGTGRLYGDHLAIQATSLRNEAEGGSAPVIAARERLDIGTTTLDNREHALVFSAGDLAIGLGLDGERRATGQAGVIHNASATIEALGQADINAATINNSNEHFSTEVVHVGSEAILEYQGSGSPYRYRAGTPGVYVFNDESDHLKTPEAVYEQWLSYDFTRNISASRIAASDPGRILSGGDMRLNAAVLNNDKSQVIAGGNFLGTVGELNMKEGAGERVTVDTGTANSYWRRFRRGWDTTGHDATLYAPPPVIEAIEIQASVQEVNASQKGGVAGSGTALAPLSSTGVTKAITPITQATAAAGFVVRSGGVDIRFPDNRLYSLAPTAHYLVETDPAFASYRNWVSSDYLLSALKIDVDGTQKRLGDGFYEQKLIRDQVAQLTGRRFLDGYADDEAHYMALMNNGATVAEAMQLVPGVSLSAAQMARLTSDIVWLVEQAVTLPDGSVTRALVPQLYVHVKDGDLQSGGALLAAENVQLQVSGKLLNEGTIAGRKLVALSAENIHNLGGRVLGQDVAAMARTDLDNTGGSFVATDNLNVVAGRDLNVSSTTRTQSNAQGSRTHVDRVAGLYVTGAGGTLTASAGRDVNLDAALIANGQPAVATTTVGPASSAPADVTVIVAGRDVNLGTVTESQSNRFVWDSKNRRTDSSTGDVGTSIQTQGNLTLQAGNDVHARAASVNSAAGELTAMTGRDIHLDTGQSRQTVDENHQHKGSTGGFASKTVTTRDSVDQTNALATTFSGKTATILANHDINVNGSNVVSDQGTTLMAQNDIKVTEAANTSRSINYLDEKRSGLMGSGGFGFTVGTSSKASTRTAPGQAGLHRPWAARQAMSRYWPARTIPSVAAM